jgi:hypothetical protein
MTRYSSPASIIDVASTDVALILFIAADLVSKPFS